MLHAYYYYFWAAIKFIECGGSETGPEKPLTNYKNISSAEMYQLLDPPTAAMTLCTWFVESYWNDFGIITKIVCIG